MSSILSRNFSSEYNVQEPINTPERTMSAGYRKRRYMSNTQLGSIITDRAAKRQRTTGSYTGPTVPRLLPVTDARVQQLMARRRGNAAALRGTGGELKTLDTSGLDTLSATPTITLLNGIAEGTGFWNRIGRKFAMRALHFRGYFEYDGNSSPSDDGDHWRIAIIYDRQTNGAVPAIADIFQEVPYTGTPATPDSMSSINMNNSDRFKVIADIRFGIPSGTNTVTQILDGQSQEFTVNRYINLGNLETHCKATTQELSSIATGSVYLITWGAKATATDCGFRFRWRCRLRFTDP